MMKYRYFMYGMFDGTDGNIYDICIPSPFVQNSKAEAMKDKNFAPKQNERDCPMTPHNLTKPVFMRVSNKFAYYLETKWQHFVVIWRIKILFHNVYKETLLIFRSQKTEYR